MKRGILPVLVFALLTYCLPLVSLLIPAAMAEANPPTSQPSTSQGLPQTDETEPQAELSTTDAKDAEVVLIQNASTGEVMEVPLLDYVIGATASEMPVNWPDAALQAQAVASHSYALYQRDNADADKLGGAWFAADPSRRQGYMTSEVLRSYWGDAYDENYARLSGLIAPILDKVLLYDGSAAAACYHAISNGHTEASENVWNQALPYLAGVDSTLDLAADGFEQTVTYTAQQMYDALNIVFPVADLSDKPQNWFGECTYTAAGYVSSIVVGGVSVRGVDVRAALSLRSACFTVSYSDNTFAVTTKGYGHGVGLSQWGAKNMALTGKTCEEILAAYYPGTTLEALG